MYSNLLNETMVKYGVDTSDLSTLSPKAKKAEIARRLSSLYKHLKEVRENQRIGRGRFQKNANNTNPRQRLIMISRRLPVSITKEKDDYNVKVHHIDELDHMMKCSLLLHLNPKTDSLWLGWHGESKNFPTGSHTPIRQKLAGHGFRPVFLDPTEEDLFYNGMCKSVLFPLFHNFPPTTEEVMEYYVYASESPEHMQHLMWQAYVKVNQCFADAVQAVYREGDLILIHDYHFMLLPQMLRTLLPHAKIGIFFHIQFPTSELYRLLPNREELLSACLHADLVGFQTYDYARHFLSTAESLLMADCTHNGVGYNGNFTSVSICPIGIDDQHMVKLATREPVRDLMKRLKTQYEGKWVYLAVDEVDVIHGIPNKLLGFEEALNRDPEFAEKVAFIQVLVNKRKDNKERELLEAQIMRTIARIRSKLCRLDSEGPIQFRVNPSITEIFALYSVADVYINTVLRDGMSANPMEYMVARDANGQVGTLVLSEFAGCARSMGGALQVSPWDINKLAKQLIKAQHLEAEERESAHSNMVRYIKGNTATLWGERIMEQLLETNQEVQRNNARPLHRENLLSAIQHSGKRLFIFSLEGVLCRRVSLPELLMIREDVMVWLRCLANDPSNMVVIQSPRSRESMEHALIDSDNTPINCVLAAEHGLYMKWGSESTWQCTLPTAAGPDLTWKSEVLPVLDFFTERAPGAVVEEKALCVSWHYWECDRMHSSWLAKQLLAQLQDLSKRLPITVSAGPRVIEIRHRPTQDGSMNLVDMCLQRMADVLHERQSSDYSDTAVSQCSSPHLKTSSPLGHLTKRIDSFKLDGSPRLNTPSSKTSRNVSFSEKQEIDESAVDFVLVFSSGQDPIDEDLFEHLEADQQDLDAFLQNLDDEREKDKEEEKEISIANIPKNPEKSEEVRPISPLLPPATLVRNNHTSPIRRRKTPRQSDISSHKKFEPRKDYPPAGILYKAMRRKYGAKNESHQYEPPDTPAACWALVSSMLPSMRHSRNNSSTSSPTPDEAFVYSVGYSVQDSISRSGIPQVLPSILDPKLFMARGHSNQSFFGEKHVSHISDDDISIDEKDKETQNKKRKRIQLPMSTFSVKVGPSVSQAAYFVKNIHEVHALLAYVNSSLQSNNITGDITEDLTTDDGFEVADLITDGDISTDKEELEDDTAFFEDTQDDGFQQGYTLFNSVAL